MLCPPRGMPLQLVQLIVVLPSLCLPNNVLFWRHGACLSARTCRLFHKHFLQKCNSQQSQPRLLFLAKAMQALAGESGWSRSSQDCGFAEGRDSPSLMDSAKVRQRSSLWVQPTVSCEWQWSNVLEKHDGHRKPLRVAFLGGTGKTKRSNPHSLHYAHNQTKKGCSAH